MKRVPMISEFTQKVIKELEVKADGKTPINIVIECEKITSAVLI
jgi:hypothetical protein